MFSVFLFLLFMVSVFTSLFVEAIKTVLGDRKYSSNLIAGIVSITLSVLVSAGYYILADLTFSNDLIVYLVALILLGWLCSMLGYDKVMQTVNQVIDKWKLGGK